MPKTGMGGMSQTHNDAILWSLFGLILATVSGAMIVRKKATNNQ
jgi:hypothetical protein